MAYTLNDIKDAPAYQDASPEGKQHIERRFTEGAWKQKTTSIPYVTGTAETKQNLAKEFNKEHPMGAALQIEEQNRENTLLQNLGLQFGQGIQETKAALLTAGDVSTGMLEADLGARIEASHLRRQKAYVPPELKTTSAHIAAESKRWEQTDTFSEKFQAAAGTIYATGREVITNPLGVAYLAAQSAAFAAPSIALGAAGSLAGPGGTIAGALSGSYATESGAYFLDAVTKEIQKRGLPVTEESADLILADKEFVADALSRSRRKGAATAITDVALSVGVGKLGTRAVRAAKATAATKLGAKATKEAIELETQTILKAEQTLRRSLTGKIQTIGAEVVTEPISEAAGQIAAEGKIDAGELMAETLGGIGAGPVMAPINVALYGTKTASKSTISKLTQAAQETRRERPPEEITAIKQAKAPTTYKYKEKVAKAVEAGRVAPEADPIMTAEVLSKVNQKEETTPLQKVQNREQAEKAYQVMAEKIQGILTESAVLTEEVQADPEGKQTEGNVQKIKSLVIQARATKKTMNAMEPLIESMKVEGTDKAAAIEQINQAIESTEDKDTREAILSIFGSRQGASLAESATIDKLIGSTTDPATKAMVEQVKTYQEAEKALETAQEKTTGQVYIDVIEGGAGFKGIREYAQAVTVAIKAGDTKTTTEQLSMLRSFATRQATKADVFNRVHEATVAGKELTPADTTAMTGYSAQRVAKNLPAYSLGKGAAPIIENVNLEVDALNKAVTMMESWVPTKAEVPVPKAPIAEKVTPPIVEKKPSKPAPIEVAVEPVVKVKEVPTAPVEEAIIEPIPKPEKEIADEKQIPVPRKEEKDRRPIKEVEEKILETTQPLEEIGEQPISETQKQAEVAARAEDGKKVGKAVDQLNETLTTPDKGDPTNRIKNDFEPKKNIQGIINTGKGDLLVSLTPEAFTDLLDDKQDSEPVLKSMRAFSKQFRTAFNREFVGWQEETIPYKTLKNVIISQFPKGVNKKKMIAAFDSLKGRDLQPTEILSTLDKAKNLHPKEIQIVKDWVAKKTEGAEADFRHRNPIQYLTDSEGKIRQQVIDALMAVSFNWLATRARETVSNDEKDIRGILGVKDSATIPAQAYDLLGNVGITQTMLQESLGIDAYQLLGIQPGENADSNLESNLINSLGLQTIASLQSMGLLEQTNVLLTAPKGDKRSLGLHGLESMVNAGDLKGYTTLAKYFVIPKDTEVKPGTGVVPFYRVATIKNKIKPNLLTRIIEPFNLARDTWALLFTGNKQKRSYTWEKPKTSKKPMRMRRTAFDVSEEQTENLQKNSQMPWKASTRTMGFSELLGEENLKKILGWEDLHKVHKLNEDSAIGVNRGIERSLDSVRAWQKDAAVQDKDYKSEFYINQYFVRQGRMHQEGDITPQGDKHHRFIFGMSEWEATIDLDSEDLRNKFMEGIALGLDIEVSKEGGLAQAIQKAEDALSSDTMVKALEGIHTILEEENMDTLEPKKMTSIHSSYTHEIKNIVAGVLKGGMKTHSLKALIEYARYQRAMAGVTNKNKFTTDLPTEIDGVSNGIILGRVQLMGSTTHQADNLAALQNGGFVFSADQPALAEHLGRDLSYDAYKATGSAWSEHLIHVEESLVKEITEAKNEKEKQQTVEKLRQFHSLSLIFGEFRDSTTGEVSNTARKASKAPTMRTTYGMGPNSLRLELQESFYADIRKKIEDIANTTKQEEAVAKLKDLNKNIIGILGHSIFPAEVEVGGQINTTALLDSYFTDGDIDTINELIKDTHFKALDGAIKQVYGPLQATFKPLNDSINVAAVRYNVIRKMKLKVLQATVGDREITVGEMQELEESIQDMFPYVTSGSGTKLPLAKMSRAKDYSFKAEGKIGREVQQKYKILPTKKAAPFKKEGVEAPGVGGTILTVHNQDSLIANGVMALFNMLNNHDGFTASVADAQEMGIAANKKCFEVLRDFDMGMAIHKATKDVADRYTQQERALKKEGITDTDINNEFASQMRNMKLKSFTNEAGKTEKINAENYIQAIKQINAATKTTAEVTKANKDILLDATVALEQYSYPGSAYVTGNKSKTIKLGGQEFIPTDITKNTETKLKESIEATKELADQIAKDTVQAITQDQAIPNSEHKDYMKEQQERFDQSIRDNPDLLMSSQSEISVDPIDYAMRQEVNNLNVVDVYDRIKNDSTVTDGASHDSHLKSILSSLVQNVMGPVDVFMKSNPDIEPTGVFTTTTSGKQRVFLSNQSPAAGPVSGALLQGIRMSTGEVYTHELLHAVLNAGLNMKPALRTKVKSLFDLAKEKLDHTAFMSDPNDAYEEDAARDRYDYIFNNTRLTTEDKNAYLDEFLAFGLSNENFMSKLAGISLVGSEYSKSSWKNIKGNNIQETFLNIGQLIMDIIYRGFRSKTTATTMDTELVTLAHLLVKRDSERKTRIYETLQRGSAKYAKLIGYGNEFVKKYVIKLPGVKLAHGLITTTKWIKESDTFFGQWLREREYAYQRLDQGLIKSMITEVAGRTDRMAPLYDLLNYRQLSLDSAKQQEIDNHIATANALFEKLVDGKGNTRTLTEDEKTSITKGLLKTDASIILNSIGLNGLGRVLSNSAELTKEVDKILSQIKKDKALAPHLTYYQRASDASGHFMIHAEQRTDERAFQSTRMIASLNGTKNEATLTGEEMNRAENLVDQLTSLYAIKYTSTKHKASLKTLLDTDSGGVNGTLRMHEVLKERALADSFAGNKYLFTKGYTRQILNSRISLMYGTLADEADFKRKGYIRKEKPLPRDPLDPTKHIPIYPYVSRVGRVNDLISSIFSYTANRAKGTPSDRIAQEMGMTTAQGVQHNKEIVLKNQKVLDNMADPNFTPRLQRGNSMVPQVDNAGTITKYRYMMSENTKDTYMEQVTAFDTILGSMAGQIVDKVRSPQINVMAIDTLKAMYNSEYIDNPDAFVEIGPNSKDPKLREIYYMLPAKARKSIQTIWGTNAMKVSKDVVDISFGYRQYSVVEAFSKDKKDMAKLERLVVGVGSMLFGEKAARYTGNLESFAIEMTKIAKSNIIVKSAYVTLGNFGSNMIYLKSRGVPAGKVISLGWEALVMGNKYQADSKKLGQLKIQEEILRKGKYTPTQLKELRAEIARTTDALSRNPTSITIEAGLMPTLVDDVEMVTSGQDFPTEFEKKIKTAADKLPSMVRSVGEVALLTENTQAYKILNNAVKMTDFIGRHVLYNHYIAGGMSHEDVVASATEEFVNFNVPTHRMVEWGNNVGLLWFTKYGTRILKIIKDSAVDRPVDVFMAFMLSSHVGMDNIMNSIPGLTKDVAANIGDPISAFVGSLDESAVVNSVDSILNR